MEMTMIVHKIKFKIMVEQLLKEFQCIFQTFYEEKLKTHVEKEFYRRHISSKTHSIKDTLKIFTEDTSHQRHIPVKTRFKNKYRRHI